MFFFVSLPGTVPDWGAAVSIVLSTNKFFSIYMRFSLSVKGTSNLIDTWATTMVIILREFLMFYQVFLSPQVKRSLVIGKNWYIRVASRVAERFKT